MNGILLDGSGLSRAEKRAALLEMQGCPARERAGMTGAQAVEALQSIELPRIAELEREAAKCA